LGNCHVQPFPITRKVFIQYETKGANTAIISDIKMVTIHSGFLNTHLQSIRFAWSDYKFIQNLNNEDVDQDELKGGLTILRRLKRAFIKRAKQEKCYVIHLMLVLIQFILAGILTTLLLLIPIRQSQKI
jgi:hypothetical protein